MILGWLAIFDGLISFALALSGVLLASTGAVAPYTGFQMFLVAFLLSLGSVLFGLIVVFLGRRRASKPTQNRGLAGALLGAMVAVPVLWIISSSAKYPGINDITTDYDNPPEFVYAATLEPNHGRDMKYDKAKYAAVQSAGYGDPAPLILDARPEVVFEQVKLVAAGMPDWQITHTDPATLSLEGVSTSRLFHFQDDVIVVVRPTADGKSQVHVRSKSRDGIGDLGVNHKRIQAFNDALASASKAGAPPQPPTAP
ncbi:MAG: DUF1499 domain-containing protein [Candidatus Binataceae bacterium]